MSDDLLERVLANLAETELVSEDEENLGDYDKYIDKKPHNFIGGLANMSAPLLAKRVSEKGGCLPSWIPEKWIED